MTTSAWPEKLSPEKLSVPVGSDHHQGPGPPLPEASLVAARAAQDKLGRDTVVLAMGELLGVTEAFVVTSGGNGRQVKSIVDEVEQQVKKVSGQAPLRVEGLRDLQWVLMDYGDFLVHVFHEETRAFYDLEHLWGNAPRVDPTAASRLNR
jgi:ribosome-associated protein